MRTQELNRVSALGLMVLSLSALLWLLAFVLLGFLTGDIQPSGQDEGVGAHVFQLLIVALVPTGGLFLATADWAHPWRSLRRLVIPAVAVILAFVILYYFENIHQPRLL